MGPTSWVLKAMLVLKGCWLGNANPEGSLQVSRRGPCHTPERECPLGPLMGAP